MALSYDASCRELEPPQHCKTKERVQRRYPQTTNLVRLTRPPSFKQDDSLTRFYPSAAAHFLEMGCKKQHLDTVQSLGGVCLATMEMGAKNGGREYIRWIHLCLSRRMLFCLWGAS